MSAAMPPVDLIGSSRAAIAANVLTISRFFLAPVLALLILRSNPTWLNFTLGWAMGATDFFDGKLARNAAPTKFGAFFDPLADKLVVLLAGFALVEIGRFPLWPMVVILIREVGIQMYRSYWSRRGLAIPAALGQVQGLHPGHCDRSGDAAAPRRCAVGRRCAAVRFGGFHRGHGGAISDRWARRHEYHRGGGTPAGLSRLHLVHSDDSASLSALTCRSFQGGA
ncbi:MAG: CDP-alcohol phosphatidyltransferase family protein [Acidimicrobiales bacterium]